MQRIVLVSAQCEGIPLGLKAFADTSVEFILLPEAPSLAERISKCIPEQRAATIAVVTLLTDSLSADQLAALKTLLPNLRLIANYAVGYNNIDVAVANDLGFAVSNTPSVLGDATADLTLTLILMVARRIFPSALEIHQHGRFAGWSPHYGLGTDLRGKTLGIVGLGDIGLKVARRAEVFGMKVVALQSHRSGGESNSGIVRLAEDEFLSVTDVLSLHCPLTPQTRGWLNAHRLRRLKKGAIVVNTARGDVVDEAALADALRQGHLFGAGLDVFCGEPVVSDVLRNAPNLLILPHLGSATVETRAAMGGRVMENIQALFSGRPFPTQVNL
jgi:glyoxylate reductase